MERIILYNNNSKKLEYTKFENVVKFIYYQEAIIPNKDHIKSYIKKYKKDSITNFFKDKVENKIQLIKDTISRYNEKIPLYDPYADNIFLIDKGHIYNKVTRYDFRFPTKDLLEELDKRREKLSKSTKEKKEYIKQNLEQLSDEQYKKMNYDILKQRTIHKLYLMLQFIDSFNIEILESQYSKIMYNEYGKDSTTCKRPSFKQIFDHINPYYTRKEIINIGLNMEIIKADSTYYDKNKVNKLCKQIIKNDISSDIIIEHQNHILTNNCVGLVEYYSLQGSYFINQYLRGVSLYDSKNVYLENIIKTMWELVDNAPKFKNDYIVYRFIEDDGYLSHLDIGDEFVDKGFTSTTRDPFYNSDEFKFGFILIKIKIPANIKGVALCMETTSHFPREQEIVLSPLSVLRLDKKDANCIFYHVDGNFETKIKTKYEFTYVDKEEIYFDSRESLREYKLIDFLKLPKNNSMTVDEKIRIFAKNNIDKSYMFNTFVGDKEYRVITEWYDSTDSYKPFYASTTQNGLSFYNITNNHITFMIEIGEDNRGPYMYVNYYFRYSIADRKELIKEKDFIYFISSIGYYFNIPIIVIYTDYTSCIKDKDERGGNYCIDFYDYLKDNKKKYKDIESMIIKPKFKYYQLDKLKTTSPDIILDGMDRDILYQIYYKIYKEFINKEKDTLADFYMWVVDKHCYLVDKLIEKMSRLYNNNNPFENDYYLLDPSGFLYNNDYINDVSKKRIDNMEDYLPPTLKNKYRINSYKRPRVPTSRKMS